MTKQIAAALIAASLMGAVYAYDGLRPGEREMLDRAYSRDADRSDYKRYRYARDNANHIGYSDRKRIRELEMDKSELNRQLRNANSYGQRRAIESQIIGIDRQIEQISAPKY